MGDYRVMKEKNKKLKQQLDESERLNKATHANMMRLEDTIKELRNNAAEQKKLMSKNKQNEKVSVSIGISSFLQLIEASEKIEELMQANQYLH